MFSSEQKFSLNGEDKDVLTKALQLMLEISGNSIKAYTIEGSKIMFFWYPKPELNIMPTTKNVDTIVNLAWDHLKSEEAIAAFQKEPSQDIDGTIRKGWEIFIPDYKDTSDSFYATIGVKLAWIYYGK